MRPIADLPRLCGSASPPSVAFKIQDFPILDFSLSFELSPALSCLQPQAKIREADLSDPPALSRVEGPTSNARQKPPRRLILNPQKAQSSVLLLLPPNGRARVSDLRRLTSDFSPLTSILCCQLPAFSCPLPGLSRRSSSERRRMPACPEPVEGLSSAL
jgi:hypothetical protein